MILDCGCPSAWPDWHDEDVDLSGHFVHRVAVPMLLHMPIGYDAQRQRQQLNIGRLGLTERWPGLTLVRTSAFRGELIRLLEEATSPSHLVAWLPRPYPVYAWLHKGTMQTLRPALRDIQSRLLDAGRMPREVLIAHLTCARCADAHGGDRILLLRHWQESRRLARRRHRASG